MADPGPDRGAARGAADDGRRARVRRAPAERGEAAATARHRSDRARRSGRGAGRRRVGAARARLVLGLTDESWRGHSGEGSLLASLAGATVAEDADLVSALLAFEPVIDVPHLVRGTGLDDARVRAALAVLAADGRVGWDVHDSAWFHRELPHDPARVEKDNPRLVGARRLVTDGAVSPTADGWAVRSRTGGPDHRVRRWSLHLHWFLAHGTGRGPCAHVLAVQILMEASHDHRPDRCGGRGVHALGWASVSPADMERCRSAHPSSSAWPATGWRRAAGRVGPIGREHVRLDPVDRRRREAPRGVRRAGGRRARPHDAAALEGRRRRRLRRAPRRGARTAVRGAVRRRGCRSVQRIWEHATSRYAGALVRLVDQFDPPVPGERRVPQGLVGVRPRALTGEGEPYLSERGWCAPEIIERRLTEHVRAAVAVGVPATGPFGSGVPAAVARGWLERDEAVDLVVAALDAAQRPGDRKVWAQVLTGPLGLARRARRARRRSRHRPGPRRGTGHRAARPAPRRRRVRRGARRRPRRHPAGADQEGAAPAARRGGGPTASVAGRRRRRRPSSSRTRRAPTVRSPVAAAALADAWGMAGDDVEPNRRWSGCWRATPPVWDVPRLELGPAPGAALTDAAALLTGRPEAVVDVEARALPRAGERGGRAGPRGGSDRAGWGADVLGRRPAVRARVGRG